MKQLTYPQANTQGFLSTYDFQSPLFLTLIMAGLFLASLLSHKVYRHYALARGILDIPNERSSHLQNTPRGGGVIFATLWLLTLCLAFGCDCLAQFEFLLLLPGTFWMSLLGFLEDQKLEKPIREDSPREKSTRLTRFATKFTLNLTMILSARSRLIIQTVIAIYTLYALGGYALSDYALDGYTISSISSLHLFTPEPTNLGLIAWPFCVLFLIWCTNAFNFMDGLDGFGALEALFVFSLGAFLFWSSGVYHFAFLNLAIVLLVLGFLIWNWPTARLFMGDAGSYFLGFSIALFALAGDVWFNIPIMVWIVAFSAFWFDATVTLIRRIYLKEPLMAPHKKHAYQRLHQSGWSHQKVLLGLSGLNALLALIALFIYYRPEYTLLGFSVALSILFFTYGLIEKVKPMQGSNKALQMGRN